MDSKTTYETRLFARFNTLIDNLLQKHKDIFVPLVNTFYLLWEDACVRTKENQSDGMLEVAMFLALVITRACNLRVVILVADCHSGSKLLGAIRQILDDWLDGSYIEGREPYWRQLRMKHSESQITLIPTTGSIPRGISGDLFVMYDVPWLNASYVFSLMLPFVAMTSTPTVFLCRPEEESLIAEGVKRLMCIAKK